MAGGRGFGRGFEGGFERKLERVFHCVRKFLIRGGRGGAGKPGGDKGTRGRNEASQSYILQLDGPRRTFRAHQGTPIDGINGQSIMSWSRTGLGL